MPRSFEPLRAIAHPFTWNPQRQRLHSVPHSKARHSLRRWCGLPISLKVALLLSGLSYPWGLIDPLPAMAASCNVGTITRVSSPVLYIDTGITPTPRGMYVGYRITNTSGSNYSDLWVKLENFAGGRVTLGTYEDGIMHVGPLASGASKMVYFYVMASGTGAATGQTHTVSLYSTRPDLAGSSVCGDNFSLSVEETIKAVANKIITTVAGPNPPELGGIMTLTVTGQTGTIGAGGIFAVSPASYADWPANAYQLVGTQITMTGGNTGTYSNTLYLSGLNSTSTDYTIVYTFVATATTVAPTTISPISQISSGTQVKHNDTGSGSLAPIQPTVNNLSLGKSASPNVLPLGGTTTYTVTLTNTGTVPATLDDLVDVLPSSPAAVSYVPGSARFNGSAIADPYISGQTLTFLNLFTVPAGGTSTLTYQATIPATLGTYINQVVGHIGSTQIDTTTLTTDNAPATASVSVGSADIVVTKTGPATVVAGGSLTYSITATNNGPAAAAGVVIQDILPAGTTFVSATNGGTVSNGVVTWPTLASLGNGASVTYQVTVQAPASGTLLNTALATSTTYDPVLSNNNGSAPSAQVSTTVTATADLSITKSHTGSFTVGQTGIYQLLISNSGPSAASGPITVTDTLPDGLTFVSGTGTGWTCTAIGQTVTCTNPNSLAPGSSSAIELAVSVGPGAASNVINTANVSSTTNDPNSANNTSSDPTVITPSADLSITKTDGQTSITPGSPITYTLTVTNNGPSTVNTLTINDTLPAALQNPVFTPSTGSYDSSTGAWTGLSLASGQSLVLTVSGTVALSATGTISNTATVSPPTGTLDPTLTNNSATDTTVITPVADLSITKTDGQNSTTPGSPITYTLTVTNNGPSTVTSVTVNDAIPTSILSPTFAASTGSYNPTTGAWTGLSLASGQSITLTVSGTVDPSSSGIISNTATVDPPADTIDTFPDNNSATDTTTIVPVADLRVTKTVDIPVPSVGEVITYAVTVTNFGPSTATNVEVQDLLPAGLTFSSGLTSQGSYNPLTGQWVVGTLTNGSSATLTIVAIVTISDPITNTAEVSRSDQVDPNSTPGNNDPAENDQDSITIPFSAMPPNLRLVKRITAINEANLTEIVNDANSTDDDATGWGTPIDAASGISTYLRGVLNGGTVHPSDRVEYTIYFLSDGGAASDVILCDLVPTNSQFIPGSFSVAPESGIMLALGSTSTLLTNVPDGDAGQYFQPGVEPPVPCAGSNVNGAVVVRVVQGATTLPATPESPAYGFIRFWVRMN